MSGSSTEFSQYLAHEKAKSIPVTVYNLDNSLRVWFIEFEQQAIAHGIDNLNTCSLHMTKYMHLIIQRWIPTLPIAVRADFHLLKEALLGRFAMDADDENRLLLKQLKQCIKQPKESIRLHAAKWEHLLSLITDKYSEQTKISFFIQSLDQRDTRLTLTSLVASMNLSHLSQVIDQAINLEVRANLLDSPEIIDTKADIIPMEIGHVSRASHNKGYNNKKKQYHNYNKGPPQHYQANHQHKPQQSKVAPRLYDRHGNPVCGHCFELHRTIDCRQHQSSKRPSFSNTNRRYNVHSVDAHHVEQDGSVNLDAPITVVRTDTMVAQPSINHVNFQHSNTPISFLSIGNLIQTLWDCNVKNKNISQHPATESESMVKV